MMQNAKEIIKISLKNKYQIHSENLSVFYFHPADFCIFGLKKKHSLELRTNSSKLPVSYLCNFKQMKHCM
jgi:hypothetical protein